MGKWRRGLACAGLALGGMARAADTYTLDTAHSAPSFSFTHLGVTTQSGHFDRASGRVVLDLAARKGSVTYEVDASSLNMGFGTETADSPGVRLFQVLRFPTIRYVSRRLQFDAAGRVVAADGQLTLLGVTRPVMLQVEHFQCSVSEINHKPMCAGDISTVIRRSEWGMTQYLPGISDEITLHVPVEAYRD